MTLGARRGNVHTICQAFGAHTHVSCIFLCRIDKLHMRQGDSNGIRIQRRRPTATKRAPCRPHHANAQKHLRQRRPAVPPRAARGFFATTKPYRAAVRPREYEHTPTPDRHIAATPLRSPYDRLLRQALLFATSTRSRQFRPSPRVAHHKPRASGPPPTPCALLHRRLPRLCVFGILYLPRISRS